MVVVLALFDERFSFCKVDKLSKKCYNSCMGKILLVDFMYLWNRLYYAYKVGNNPEGYYPHLLNVFKGLDKDKDFVRKYVILDGKHCSQRHKALLPSYKEGREPKDKVYQKIDTFIKEITTSTSTLSFQRADEYEADEVIASWVRYFRHDDVLIYSGDKDLIQLTIYGNVYIGDKYESNKPLAVIPYTPDEMVKKAHKMSNNLFGDYTNILKFRVFRGDSSDKIPSVVPKIRSKLIVDTISRWDVTKPLTDETISKMCEGFTDSSVKDNIRRNYELMNLIHLPYKDILKSVKELKVKK